MLPKNHTDELRIFQSMIDTCLSFTGGLSMRKLSTLPWKNLHLQESHPSELIKSFYLQLDFNIYPTSKKLIQCLAPDAQSVAILAGHSPRTRNPVFITSPMKEIDPPEDVAEVHCPSNMLLLA
ncbi:hypothetical protein ACTXT7_016329 [Hymenolepis weldensis]